MRLMFVLVLTSTLGLSLVDEDDLRARATNGSLDPIVLLRVALNLLDRAMPALGHESEDVSASVSVPGEARLAQAMQAETRLREPGLIHAVSEPLAKAIRARERTTMLVGEECQLRQRQPGRIDGKLKSLRHNVCHVRRLVPAVLELRERENTNLTTNPIDDELVVLRPQ